MKDGKTSAGLVGTEICGRTVGIVGCGQIGFKTARLFKAFGAEVLAYARHEKEEWKEAGIRYADIDTLLKESQAVQPASSAGEWFWHLSWHSSALLCRSWSVIF